MTDTDEVMEEEVQWVTRPWAISCIDTVESNHIAASCMLQLIFRHTHTQKKRNYRKNEPVFKDLSGSWPSGNLAGFIDCLWIIINVYANNQVALRKWVSEITDDFYFIQFSVIRRKLYVYIFLKTTLLTFDCIHDSVLNMRAFKNIWAVCKYWVITKLLFLFVFPFFLFFTGRKVWFHLTFLALDINRKLYACEKCVFVSLFIYKAEVRSSSMWACMHTLIMDSDCLWDITHSIVFFFFSVNVVDDSKSKPKWAPL